MRKIRPKYKVLLERGRNALRRMWKRTERNRRKWKLKKTGLLVRKSRKVKRVTATNARRNDGRLSGGRTPRHGKLKRSYEKKRHGRKGRKRRYGGGYGSEVSTKRRSSQRRQNRDRIRKVEERSRAKVSQAVLVEVGSSVKDPLKASGMGKKRVGSAGYKSRTTSFRTPRDHVRGFLERRAEVRRWRAGRARTLRASRRMVEKGVVSVVNKSSEVLTDSRYVVRPGEGRMVSPEYWSGLKGVLLQTEFGPSPRSLARKRNGRYQRRYVVVDYVTGTVRVKRNPRSGEVLRPARMERCRWMF